MEHDGNIRDVRIKDHSTNSFGKRGEQITSACKWTT